MNAARIYDDGTYLDNNPTWHEEDSPWKARQIWRLLQRNRIDPSTLCEVGCGAGEVLNRLAREHGDRGVFTGYEISAQAFAICRRKERPNLRFFLKDLFEERDSTFDVVMAIDVIEHVEDYFGFLRRLRERGRYKIFHIPLDLSVQTVLRGSPMLRGRSSVGHIHYFTKDTALATLKDTGYEVVDWFYTGGSLELPNRGWKANLLNLPRRVLFLVNRDLTVRVLGGFSLLVLAE